MSPSNSMLWSTISYTFGLLHVLLGLMFIFAALFLYEDEERRIQSKVEEWWIKLSDKQSASRSQDAAFMQEVAKLTGRGFDRLLGKRLLSLRFVFISICFSIASVFLLGSIIYTFRKPPAGESAQGSFLSFLIILAFALVPAFTDSKILLGIWWLIILVNLIQIVPLLLFFFRTYGGGVAARSVGYVVLALAISLSCDLSYIAITRWILRRISKIDRVYEIVLQILLNLLILALLIWLPMIVGEKVAKFSLWGGGTVWVSIELNLIDSIAGFAGLILAFVLLLHHLLWPMIQRPLYAICRFAPLKNKRLLWTIGLSLIFLPTHITIELLKSLLHKL
ncbi:MAG TPA: hypothetical protein VKO18_02545 [Terriglobia bacterium]|nr:hypothetical protein [Terriglobia bacterium]